MKFSLNYKLLLLTILISGFKVSDVLAKDNILINEIASLEKMHKDKFRVGFYAIDIDTRKEIGYRSNEKFLLASTIKLPVAIYLMNQVDQGKIDLAKMINISRNDFTPGSGEIGYFITHEGLSISNANLLELMIAVSDNTATDLIIKQLGMDNISHFFKNYAGISLKSKIIDLFSVYYNLGHENDKSIIDQVKLYRQKDDKEQSKYARKFYYNFADRTTPKVMAEIINDFMHEKFTTSKSKEFLLSVMSRTANRKRLVGNIAHSTQMISHKTGTFDHDGKEFSFACIGDVGVIKLNSGKNIAIAMYIETENTKLTVDDLEPIFANVTRIIIDYFLFVS